jgi:hypothetical protein
MASYNIKVLRDGERLAILPSKSELYNFLVSANTKKEAEKLALIQVEMMLQAVIAEKQMQKWIDEGAARFKMHRQLRKVKKAAKKAE